MRVRIASFNTALSSDGPRVLIQRLSTGEDPKAQAIAAILQRVRPDIVLLNEFDYDAQGVAVGLFRARYLARSQRGDPPLDYAHHYAAPVNTGEPSGLDLNGDGQSDGPEDAYGFGRFPGQYGMVLLSRFPIDAQAVRSFQLLRWASMPGALVPRWPDGRDYYPPAIWAQLRLSSKSHWDLPIAIGGRRLHVLAAHPTPPSFDGPEDRNGRRNHDEIRLWADYLDPARANWIVDDRGRSGGLPVDQPFVILGDLNADPRRGNSVDGAIQQLLEHPRVDADRVPQSHGAIAAAAHALDPAEHAADTADFGEPVPGNLRVDYALPARGLTIIDSGVYWPAEGEEGAGWVRASDHRLVWVDLEWRGEGGGS